MTGYRCSIVRAKAIEVRKRVQWHSRSSNVSTNHRASRTFSVVALGTVVSCLAFLVGPAVMASTTHASTSPLKRGLAFYRGKTIKLIAGSGAGSQIDVFSRDVGPYLGTYLHATVDVVNIPGANQIAGEDAAAAASPDGLTLGLISPLSAATLAITNTPGLNFNPERVDFIGGGGTGVNVLIAAPGTFTSFAALKNSPTPVRVLTQSSGSTPTNLETWLTAFGVKVQYVTGYSSQAAVQTGFQRGDGPIALLPLTNAGPLVAQGKAVALTETYIPPVGTIDRAELLEVPTISKLMQRYPAKTKAEKHLYSVIRVLIKLPGLTFYVPTKTAADKVAALRAALGWSYKQGGLKTELLANSNDPDLTVGDVAKQAYIQLLKLGKYLRLAIGGVVS